MPGRNDAVNRGKKSSHEEKNAFDPGADFSGNERHGKFHDSKTFGKATVDEAIDLVDEDNWYLERGKDREYKHDEPDDWYFRRSSEKQSQEVLRKYAREDIYESIDDDDDDFQEDWDWNQDDIFDEE